jgi:excisionase family DNA binding protein
MSRTVKPINPETFITSHEAGVLLQSNPSSINKWVKEGRIKAHATPGGHRRILARDLVAFLVEYEMPIPDALVFEEAVPVKTARKK